jgi:hypothetical protein
VSIGAGFVVPTAAGAATAKGWSAQCPGPDCATALANSAAATTGTW